MLVLLWDVCILCKEHLIKIVGNVLCHSHEEPITGQSGKDKSSSGGDVLKFTNNCQLRLDTSDLCHSKSSKASLQLREFYQTFYKAPGTT